MLSMWQRRVLCSDVTRKAAHVIVAALLVSIIGLSQAGIAESKAQKGDPAVFIQSLADQAIQVLSASSGSLREREDGSACSATLAFDP